MTPTFCFLRSSLLGLGCVSLFLAVACSDDSDSDSGDGSLGGSAGAGSAQGGSSGNAGSAGSSGSGGSGGSSGSAGTAGSGGTGAAGSGGSSGAGGSAEQGDAGPGPDAGATAFVLTSTAFDDNAGCGPDGDAPDACDLFPDDNIGLGTARNVSPQIDWVGAPAGTQSFAIALHDLSNPFGHWVVWNIPASATGLPAELPRGTSPGVPADDTGQIGFNDDDIGYEGSGQCGNVYEFVLYALGTPSFEPTNTDSPDDVEAELELSDDVLDTTTMRARSDPNGPTCN
jgi:phosphatidylethanolamine-binding protein (PEBP) family uncharacterized protein